MLKPNDVYSTIEIDQRIKQIKIEQEKNWVSQIDKIEQLNLGKIKEMLKIDFPSFLCWRLVRDRIHL